MDCSLCVTCQQTSYQSKTGIVVVLGQVMHRLQTMSYSGMRFVDKLHTDYNPRLTPV
jgi:hypothetical protein